MRNIVWKYEAWQAYEKNLKKALYLNKNTDSYSTFFSNLQNNSKRRKVRTQAANRSTHAFIFILYFRLLQRNIITGIKLVKYITEARCLFSSHFISTHIGFQAQYFPCFHLFWANILLIFADIHVFSIIFQSFCNENFIYNFKPLLADIE